MGNVLVKWTTIHPNGTQSDEYHVVKHGEFHDFGDGCLKLFGLALPHLNIPADARILEVGCYEADWLASLTSPWL